MIESGQLTLDTFIAKQSAWITQLIQQYSGTTLAIRIPEGPVCPLCGSATRQRTGKPVPFGRATVIPTVKAP